MDKKQIRTIFLFQLKLCRSAVETARDINVAFGSRTTNERTVQRWFKKISGGDESLEDEQGRGRPCEMDSDKLRALIDADPGQTTREVAEEFGVDHSTVVRHLKLIGKKSLAKRSWQKCVDSNGFSF
ncbi:hypothetical protein Q1695_003140 [Nippostrongylus brasiliensis]|nr:hypothetical protein Q1695_003140 [Nippostrongylus brasiliensis]